MKFLDPTRCEIGSGVSNVDLEQIANDAKIQTVQFYKPLKESEIERLERIVFSQRDDITLRVYGHYGLTCDLAFLEKIPSLRKLSTDCLLRAINVHTVSGLKKLTSLTIDISNLESFDFLDQVSPKLTQLGLGTTFSKKPTISAIGRFEDLRFLYLEGQQKGIQSLRELRNLEKVVLRSISTSDVGYLEGLEKLWSVDVKLGGIKNLDSLAVLKNLKYLELWMVRGLNDLSFISKIHSLQNLFLQSLKQVSVLPDFSFCPQLRRIYLEDLKGLVDLSSLEFAPQLEEFSYTVALNQKPENLLPVLRNPSLQSVHCGFGSIKKNEDFGKLAREYGKRRYVYSDFVYR